MAKTNPLRNGNRKHAWRLGLAAFSVLALISACVLSDSEMPESDYGWTWISGSDLTSQAGVYGTKGVPSSSNFPGARGYASTWLDPSGQVWLFGGQAYDSAGDNDEINDLWKYNPTTLEWTWVSGSNTINQLGSYGTRGVASPANIPGARDTSFSWVDSSGKYWVFGGWGLGSSGTDGHLNDLWRIDPSTLQWTWVSGGNTVDRPGVYGAKGTAAISNIPGGRYGEASWRDSSGGLWLFGGVGLDSASVSGELNDLWKFDPATLEWTWVSGADMKGRPGSYGALGIAVPTNVPGGRVYSASWLDANGKFWLFGGIGYDSAGNYGLLNDLWKFDPTTTLWTWVSGSNSVDQPGVYGTLGAASPANVPGGNKGACPWLDSAGKLWLFGGSGYDSAGNLGLLNDLWKFDPTTLQWTWVSGNKLVNKRGVYGTQGRRTLSNVPGGREKPVSWLDSNGRLWLFGGWGIDSRGAQNYLNDLWNYTR
jgi:N-acetylneuraminic acid mutarotase